MFEALTVRRHSIGPLVAVTVIAGTIGVWFAIKGVVDSAQSRSLRKLTDTVAAQRYRPFRARLSGTSHHQPLRRLMRGMTAPDASRSSLLVATQATSSDPYVAGIASLRRGDAERSVELLKRAVSSGTADASSDLAAALLVQSDSTSCVLPALDALVAANQALRIDPHHAPAAFNRSLALEKLGLIEEAASAWNDYRTIDPTPSWAAEARAAAAKLKRQIGTDAVWRQIASADTDRRTATADLGRKHTYLAPDELARLRQSGVLTFVHIPMHWSGHLSKAATSP